MPPAAEVFSLGVEARVKCNLEAQRDDKRCEAKEGGGTGTAHPPVVV